MPSFGSQARKAAATWDPSAHPGNREVQRSRARPPRVYVPPARSWKVIGQTLDSAGAALPNMTVFLLRASTLELISRGTSDGAGNYSLPAIDNAGSYIVVSYHPDGSVAGVTRPILAAVSA